MSIEAMKHKCTYPNCPYPCLDLPDCIDAKKQDGDCQQCGGKGCVACDARKQEPVAWRTFDGEGGYDYRSFDDNENYRNEFIQRNGDKYKNWVDPLYTPLPKREWVGLTDEEVVDLKMLGRDLEFVSMTALRRFARDIEQTLKEKNT